MSDESGNAGGGGDDLSSLSGFFFYVFIVHPATAWILKPGRFERKKSIMYAIGFLAMLAAVKTGKFILCISPCLQIMFEIVHHILLVTTSLIYVIMLSLQYLKNIRNGNAGKGSKPLLTPWSLP